MSLGATTETSGLVIQTTSNSSANLMKAGVGVVAEGYDILDYREIHIITCRQYHFLYISSLY